MSFRFINGYLEIDYIRVAQLLDDWRDSQDKIEAAFEEHYESVHSGQYDYGYAEGYEVGKKDTRNKIANRLKDWIISIS